MGLEVSWYLRFARTDVVEVLVSKDSAPQLDHVLIMEPQWKGESREQDGALLFTYTRKKPSDETENTSPS